MTLISIIMPCYNRAQDLRRTLFAYENQSGDVEFEIIAIDDGSTDSTFQELTSFASSRFTLQPIRLEVNQGPAAARNRGIASAQSGLILFVGDDIAPETDFIQKHFDAHQEFPENHIAILGQVKWPPDIPVNTLMEHIDGVGAQQFSYHYFEDREEYDYRHFYTANISLKREFLLTENKGFDTGFPYAAFEDVELAYRLSKKGLKIIYIPEPVGYHYHYHSIWSFSTRQYRAGQMACILVRKHPRTAKLILGKRWIQRYFSYLARTMSGHRSNEKVADIENAILQCVSALEWAEQDSINDVYLLALQYYFHKGLYEGFFGWLPFTRSIQQAYAKFVLSSITFN